jgi:hypothetical protein
MVAELLNAFEQAVHIAGVFAYQVPLQHMGVYGVGAVAHLAVALQPLVGHNFNNRAAHGRAAYVGNAHVGDAQGGRDGTGVDIANHGIGHFSCSFPLRTLKYFYL